MPRKSLVQMSSPACSRRAFLEAIGIASAAVAVLSSCVTNGANQPTAITTTCGASECIDLTDAANAALATAGGSMVIDAFGDTILVVRVSDSEILALSAVCTHAGCIVDYNASASRVDCNCHGSEFGTDGHVIRGPANRPLRRYTASLANQTITVTS